MTNHDGTRDGAHLRAHSGAAGNSSPVLELDEVTVTFSSGLFRREHVHAMRGVSLRVEPGETLGLVGESGSGKTTASMVALGLRRPSSGAVRFEGAPLPRRRRELAGRMQVVLQHPQWSLDPRMWIGHSVAEPLVALGHSQPGDAVRAMLEEVGLEPSFADRYPHELSGGQRQRVAVARALITRPRFIVFDEAVSALDVSVQAQILNLITDLQAEFGFSALFISHDLGAVRYVAHRIAVMRHGEVVETADTETFYTTPVHEYSRQLLEAL
ncbi:ATP-binding cassette domain-containing protein [Phytoactinopolyspora halotolerans]|uniref:ABC transporter ATP-binding protein n=1 Tax=Phytoactinopolyspora halotolerans TaxID=1981512 RepID=A0A6L9S892_9ACTN|nr:ATP-binding cassette domain-containing protein [Phytoactinopolyspora halotolerans]NEE00200.1 ABC transporter ATP-binding protein [Phytoactinopolyspora halotolerans]